MDKVKEKDIGTGMLFPRGFKTDQVFAWELVRAGELVTLNYGKALVAKDRAPGSVPVYGTNGQCGWSDKSLYNGPSVILGRKGMGHLGVEWCDKPFWVIDTAYYATPNRSDIDMKFFYFLVKYIGLNHLKDGTSNPSLSRNTFYAQALPLPPIHEQQAIASILGALDDKIELNRRMNETLESMAHALFQSWFIDFDPVRARMEGRQPYGMAAETAALFPGLFEDSQIGEIPSGWKIEYMADLSDFVLGGDWGNETRTDETPNPVLCIRGADLPSLQEGGIGSMPTRFIGKDSLQKRSLRAGDLTIEISGGSPTQSTGRVVLVTDKLLKELPLPLTCSNFCRIVRIKPGISPAYIYVYFRWLYEQNAFLQFENGTTGIKNFAYTVFSQKYPLLLPPPEVISAFHDAITPLFERRQHNGAESRTLASLRNTLLPKLMSGEIRVRDAEKELEAVL